MTSQLAPNWTAIAATHASTQWLKRFIMTTLPQLQDQSLSAEEFAQALTEELEKRNLTTPAKQKNYRSNVCQALKSFDPNHPAIALISPTTEQYRELNDAQRGKLADRETKFFTSTQAEAIVERATGLLDSAEWSEVAAGLAVLIGRRISEILLSGFESRSEWSLSFSEMAKKADTTGMTIEIPTLAPAQTVLTAIQKLQRNLKIEDLKLASLSSKMAKQKVNSLYSEAVASQCHESFADLIPTRTDRETLYTHLFRAVYATIAAHWFCPPNTPEHNFKAEIQGHFSLTQDGRKLPNFSARSNYDDYAIGTPDGNRDGRLGIKLGTLPGLQVIKAFRKPEASPALQPPLQPPKTMDITTLSEGDRNALVYRAANLLSGPWAEMAVGLELLTGLRSDVLHTAEVEEVSTYILRVDGEEVETLVQQLKPRIDKFQKLEPDEDEATLESIVDLTFTSLVKLRRDDLPQVYAAILQSRHQKEKAEDVLPPQAPEEEIELSTPAPPITPVPTMPEPKPQIRQSRLYALDVEKMIALMLQRGVTGSPAEVFHAMVNVLESEQFQQQQTQTLSEVAQTMNWFTSKVERLEATIELLQQERSSFQSQVGEAQAIERLQSENHQLQQTLAQTQSRLTAIEKLFGTETIERLLSQSPVETSPKKPESRGMTVSAIAAHAPMDGKGESGAVQSQRPPRSQTGRRSREEATEEANQKIDAIIEAILSWNNSQDNTLQCLRITYDPIRAIGRLIGASSQDRATDGLERHKERIDEMHGRLGLGTYHNRQVKQKQEILRSIARENLGLENWQEVEWH